MPGVGVAFSVMFSAFSTSAGDVDAAVADAFARQNELQIAPLRDLSGGVANLLRQLIGHLSRTSAATRSRRSVLRALLSRLDEIDFSSRNELILIALVFRPVADDALHVHQADGALRRAAGQHRRDREQ